MQKIVWGTLIGSASFVAVAACVADEPAAPGGDIADNDASDSQALGDQQTLSDGGGAVDSGQQCGYPGEACCTGPLAPCNVGTTCSANHCVANDIWIVGSYSTGILEY